MMKEDLITYDTAKLAKEKGFDLESSCRSFYTKPRSKMFGVDEHGRTYPMKNTSKKLYFMGDHAALNYKNVMLAPTQSPLQKWLREEHNIIVLVHKPVGYMCTVNGRSLGEKSLASYEDVLEQGLYEGLKLIK